MSDNRLYGAESSLVGGTQSASPEIPPRETVKFSTVFRVASHLSVSQAS